MAETVYFTYQQIVAIENAIREINKDGISMDSIKVVNNGPDKPSWLEIEPTQARWLICLGLKAGKYLYGWSLE